MGGNRYNSDMPTQKAIKAHIEDQTIHPRSPIAAGSLVLAENYTYRGDATGKAVATDILKTHTDGSEITVDHSDGTDIRVPNLVYAVYPNTLVAANTTPIGTLGIELVPCTPFIDYAAGASETHTPTIDGVTIDTDTKRFGDGSGFFSINHEVTYPDSADWNFGTGGFTISAWLLVSATGGVFWASQFDDANNYQVIHISKTRIEYYNKVGGAAQVYIDKSSTLSNGWHHIEIGWDRATSGYIFIDGVKQTLDSNTYGGTCGDFSTTLRVGWYNTSWAVGNIDVFKIDKGICRHSADFTPPKNEDVDNDSYTKLLLKMNEHEIGNIYINIADTWVSLGNGSSALSSVSYLDLPSLTSAELAAKITDETGSGLAVFGTSPTLTTPTIAAGTVSSNNKLYWRDTGLYLYSQADSYLDIVADGGVRIGDGVPTNYAKFASDGELTLTGTARVNKIINLGIDGLAKGSTAPSEVKLGNWYGYGFGINDDGYVRSFELPYEWDSSVNPILKIHWYINEAYALQSAEVKWQVNYSPTAETGETVDGATIPLDTGDINIPATAKELIESTITLTGIAVEDVIGMSIKRIALTGGTDPTAEPVIVSLELEYRSNKLGEAT